MTAPLRVLAAVDSLWVGGTERSLVEMLPGLEERGIEVSIACFRRRPGEGVEGEVPADRLCFLDRVGLLGQVRALRELLVERRPAILHTALFHANLVGRLAAAGLPVVLLNSLVTMSYDPKRRADPGLRAWRLRVVRSVDAVTGRLLTDHYHAVSEAAADSAVRTLGIPRRRITVVRRGREPRRLGEPSETRRRRARRALGVPEGAPLVVSVARQEYPKGLVHLLRAADRLREAWPALKVLVVGRRGAATPALERLAEDLELESIVGFLGHREDVPEILAAADLFALPSLFEGLPGAVIEAMALGLPIVASDIPAVREVVEPSGNAVLVAPEDDGALAEALAALLADPTRARALGRRSRELFEAHWTLERAVAEMAALYRSLADPPHRR